MTVLFALAILSILIGLGYYVYLLVTPKKNTIKKETQCEEDPSIAILIPARNESLVIEGLLNSIEKQTIDIPSSHVYVIVESLDDPTVEIVKKHHM